MGAFSSYFFRRGIMAVYFFFVFLPPPPPPSRSRRGGVSPSFISIFLFCRRCWLSKNSLFFVPPQPSTMSKWSLGRSPSPLEHRGSNEKTFFSLLYFPGKRRAGVNILMRTLGYPDSRSRRHSWHSSSLSREALDQVLLRKWQRYFWYSAHL